MDKLIPSMLVALMCITLLLIGYAPSSPDYYCVPNGKDRSCSYESMSICQSMAGCYIESYHGGSLTCAGSPEPCSNYSDQLACNNDYGCKWKISECSVGRTVQKVVAAIGVCMTGLENVGRRIAQPIRIVHLVKGVSVHDAMHIAKRILINAPLRKSTASMRKRSKKSAPTAYHMRRDVQRERRAYLAHAQISMESPKEISRMGKAFIIRLGITNTVGIGTCTNFSA